MGDCDRAQQKDDQASQTQMTHSQLTSSSPAKAANVPHSNPIPNTSTTSTNFNFADVNVLQPKLTLGEPNDPYEQEADRVASEVVKKIHSGQAADDQDDTVQRSLSHNFSFLTIQRDGGVITGVANGDFEAQLNQARSGGSSLEPKLQGKLESAMGTNFSRVKIHTDQQADQLSQSIQAKAFTTGQDIFFKQGAYNPGSKGGQELIAHELTHVVQQNSNTVQRQPQKEFGQKSQPLTKRVDQSTQIKQANASGIQRDPEGQIGVRPGHEENNWKRYQINLDKATEQIEGKQLKKLGKQGALGDCWVISSIIALGYTKPEKLLASIEEGTSDTIDDDIKQTFKVKLYPMNDQSGANLAPSGEEPKEIEVDTQLPVTAQEQLLYAGKGSKASSARLIGIIEKALAVEKGLGSYANLGSDSARRALGMLTGKSTESLDLVRDPREATSKLKDLQTNINNTTVVINSERPKRLNPTWKKDPIYKDQIDQQPTEEAKERKMHSIRRRVNHNPTRDYQWSNAEAHAMAVLGFAGDKMKIYDQGLGYTFEVTIQELVSNDYCHTKEGTRNDKFDFKWKFGEVIWLDWSTEEVSDSDTTEDNT